MKKYTDLLLIFVVILGLAFCGNVQAANVTWDTAPGTVGVGNGGITGGAGAWNTTNGNWTIDSGANNIAWVNGNNDTAVFGATAGTVTNEGVTVGGLTFNTASYIVTSNTLTFGAAGIISNSVAATIASALAGTGPITKNGAGTLTLSGANTFSGGLVINAGNITLGTSGVDSLGASGGTVTVNATTTLTLDGTTTFNKSLVLTNNAILYEKNGSGPVTITGAVTGNGGLAPTDAGASEQRTLSLTSTSNTFTGPILLGYSGNFQAISVNSLADVSGAGNISLYSGSGASFIWGAGAIVPLTLNYRQIEISSATANANLSIKNVNASAANTITINTSLLITANGAKTLLLGGSNTGANTFAGTIGNSGAGATSVTKVDGGRWILSGTNTYTGVTTISGGTLQVASLANGGANSPIGASGNGAGSLILNGGRLRYTGTGVSIDRLFSLQVSSSLDASGTGAVNFNNTGAMGFNTGATAKTLTLTGINTNNNTIAAIIGDLTLATAITKSGIGTWVLSGANTNTGATTLSGGGTLILDYGSGADNSKLSDTAALTLKDGAGNITLRGGSHLEAVGPLTMSTGGGHTSITRDGGSSKIAFGAITRAANDGGPGGVTLSLAEDSLATTTSTVGNGILTGGITVGSNWAKVDGTSNIVALTSGDYTTLAGSVGAGTVNYQLTGGLTAGNVTVNSLRIVGNGADQVFNLGSSQLRVSQKLSSPGGGLLYAGGGNDNYTITGSNASFLQAQNGSQELNINTYQGTLNVAGCLSMGIGQLTKTGVGTLCLSSNSTYSGITYVNQGVLRLVHANGAGTTGAILVQNGAALELTNNISVGAKALSITGTGISNGGALRNTAGNTSTYGGTITIGDGGARINSDSDGSLTLTNGIVTALFNDVTFGGSGNITVSGVISGAGGLIKDGTGILTLSGASANTYTGDTLVNNGKLLISSTNNAIANGSILRIASGARVELATDVDEIIGSLYVNGQPASPGTWGSISSGADNKDTVYFIGLGKITVSQLGTGTPYRAQGPGGTVIMFR